MLLCTCRSCPEGPQVSKVVRQPRLLPSAHSVHRVGGHETHISVISPKESSPSHPYRDSQKLLFCFTSNQLPDCSLAFGEKKKKKKVHAIYRLKHSISGANGGAWTSSQTDRTS